VANLSHPLKVVGRSRMAFQTGDRDLILDQPCRVCGGGIVRSLGDDLYCTDCLTSFVEEGLSPSETAYRENLRRSHARR
jgi:hypothetical protein